MFKEVSIATTLLATSLSATTSAQDIDNSDIELADDTAAIEELTVLGSQEDLDQLSGSAHRLGRDALEDFEYTDLNQVLVTVPGVYIRQEDGYGLRPNIGIRGVTSERSQKITIMEDGILITPAPYSAPAAYYVPNINRMQAVEVFKGPAAIKFGPNTVGGAVNLATRPVPENTTGEVDIAYGTDNFQKYRVLYGESFEQFGYMVEALDYSADGFKELDGGGNTGFERSDYNAKLMWRSDATNPVQQRIDFKIGYADETSDEAYLGLTNTDFDANPVRRYAATAEDKFTSEHVQTHLIHQVDFSDQWSMVNRFYYNQYERSWLKIDGFYLNRNVDLHEVITQPSNGDNARYLDILKGEQASASDDDLSIKDNDRSYASMGADFNAAYQTVDLTLNHKVELGLRYHYDYVEREHTAYRYQMLDGGRLNYTGRSRLDTDNKGESTAISAYINDTMSIGQWNINLGLRLESIEQEFNDYNSPDRNNKTSENTLLPGVGVFYNVTEEFGLLAGINKGFSPNGAAAKGSSSGEAEPEESINYEFGARYNHNNLKAELIGFFSDYSNLIGRCGANDNSCAGEEFNAGSVEVAGLEASVEQVVQTTNFAFPLGFSYTYTESAFQESFTTGFSQWKPDVQQGDALPYLPEHQGRLYAGIRAVSWDLLASLKHVSEMRDSASQGNIKDGIYTPALTTLDLSASYFFNDSWTLQMVVDNVTDEQEQVSYRPDGARPNKPRSVVGTVKYRF